MGGNMAERMLAGGHAMQKDAQARPKPSEPFAPDAPIELQRRTSLSADLAGRTHAWDWDVEASLHSLSAQRPTIGGVHTRATYDSATEGDGHGVTLAPA
jgi:hypothetical protein